MKFFSNYLTLVTLSVIFGTHGNVFSQNRVEFSVRNPKVIGDMYSAEIWAKVHSDAKSWAISGCNIVLSYNAKSLDPTWFNNASAVDVNAELVGKNDYFDVTQTQAGAGRVSMNISKIMPPYTEKIGEFRIASFRWKILDAYQSDNLKFDTELTQIFYKMQMLGYNCQTEDCYGVLNPIPVLSVGSAGEKIEEMAVSVSPNPAKNTLWFSALNMVGKGVAVISGVDGKEMIRLENLDIVETKQAIDITQLSSGTYFLKVTISGKTGVQKFVKD